MNFWKKTLGFVRLIMKILLFKPEKEFMNRSQYLVLISCLVFFFLFVKIYQHNAVVKLMYQKQRIENQKAQLTQRKNDLMVKLYSLKNQHHVRALADKNLSLLPLKPDQIITIT
jgi:hypothetical protein